jgi:hypothetical protein
VSQTEGKELPELSPHVTGNAGEYRERLVDFVIGQGIEIRFNESIAPALSVSYGGKIALFPGQSTAEEFSTLVHELAHLCSVSGEAPLNWRSQRGSPSIAPTQKMAQQTAARHE